MNSRSLRTEIVAGFATLVLALGLIGGYAVVRQARAVEALRLQNQGYLPLALRLADAISTQAQTDAVLERFIEVQDRAAWRAGLQSALRTRRGKIHLLRNLALGARSDARAREDLDLLAQADRTLGSVERTYRDDERDFAAMFDAIGASDLARARSVQRSLYEREGGTETALLDLTRAVGSRIEGLAAAAEQEQPRTLRVLAAVTATALVIGIAMLLSAVRALRPLALLIDRVRAVAGGDLSPRIVPARADEIGELAREFDNMVDAVKARDTALREKADEIRRTEEHLEQVVATLRAAVMVVRRDGIVTSANPAAARLAGDVELVRRPFRDTAYGGVAAMERAVADVLAGRCREVSVPPVAMGDRSLEIAVVRFDAPREQAAGALVVADDVTEREQARARMLQNERLAAIGRMAAHVTHEVRNPLSSMALNAEMLADEGRALGDSGREVQRLIGAIQREIDRLTGITEEYLRVARLPQPRLEREDIESLVRETLAFVDAEFTRAEIQRTVRVEPGVPSAMADEAQVRQALLNILRNAREVLESRPRGARRISITIEPASGGVQLSVADSGPGIQPEVRAHLFELFFTTKERGTGLGLPLTREIVMAHGGTIHVADATADEGSGARFVIWLPAAPAQELGATGGTRDAA